MWRRLLVNISGSVVCMLVERPVSVASEVSAINDLLARLSREGAAVALANGVTLSVVLFRLVRSIGFPDTISHRCCRITSGADPWKSKEFS
jgi:hypothetical protein